MDPVTIGITMLGHAGKYLLDNGGKEVVNKAAHDLYDWVKGKFSKPAQQEKVEALKSDPDNKQAQEEAKKLLSGSLDFDVISETDLQEQAQKFEATITQQDPEWLAKHGVQIKHNKMVIEGDHGIGIQDVSDSQITINKG